MFLFNSIENSEEKVLKILHKFEVMLFDCHFNVKGCKLRQMFVRSSSLTSENWTYLEYSLKITQQAHLSMVSVGRRQKSLFAKIIQAKRIVIR